MAYRRKIFEQWTHPHEAARRGRKTSALSVFALAHLADMMLRVELLSSNVVQKVYIVVVGCTKKHLAPRVWLTGKLPSKFRDLG
jgi:hypothetical protein